MIRVLNLVTNKRPFFNSQVEILEKKGVMQNTISVPGKFDPDEDESRSVTDYMRFYSKVLRESFKSYDIIHANSGRTAPHAIMQPNLPVVISFWGLDVVSSKYMQSSISKFAAKRADEVIVMSEDMAHEFDHPVTVIPHGVDMQKFSPMSRERALDSVGWETSSKHVLFPYSTTREEKNYDLARDIVDNVHDNSTHNVQLHAVSGVSHNQIPTYMNASDVLLLTSRYEGSPNTVKEAMACNLPIVSTDVGDVSERLGPVDNSYVCQDKEMLFERTLRVISSGERSNGRDFVQLVSLETMGNKIINVYNRTI